MQSASTYLEWKTQGRVEGLAEGMALGMQEARRADLLKVLHIRFPGIPYDVTTCVRGMTDLDQLGRWFEAALIAPSVDQFRTMAADADGVAEHKKQRGRWG
jgi:hypothetical protein